MKLRISDRTITIRLQPEEMSRLEERRFLSQKTVLPNNTIEVMIEVQDVADIDMDFFENVFRFVFPSGQLREWVNTSKIGFTRKYDDLTLIIEKDVQRKKH